MSNNESNDNPQYRFNAQSVHASAAAYQQTPIKGHVGSHHQNSNVINYPFPNQNVYVQYSSIPPFQQNPQQQLHQSMTVPQHIHPSHNASNNFAQFHQTNNHLYSHIQQHGQCQPTLQQPHPHQHQQHPHSLQHQQSQQHLIYPGLIPYSHLPNAMQSSQPHNPGFYSNPNSLILPTQTNQFHNASQFPHNQYQHQIQPNPPQHYQQQPPPPPPPQNHPQIYNVINQPYSHFLQVRPQSLQQQQPPPPQQQSQQIYQYTQPQIPISLNLSSTTTPPSTLISTTAAAAGSKSNVMTNISKNLSSSDNKTHSFVQSQHQPQLPVQPQPKGSAALQIINPETNDLLDLSIYKDSNSISTSTATPLVNDVSKTHDAKTTIKKSVPLLIQTPEKCTTDEVIPMKLCNNTGDLCELSTVEIVKEESQNGIESLEKVEEAELDLILSSSSSSTVSNIILLDNNITNITTVASTLSTTETITTALSGTTTITKLNGSIDEPLCAKTISNSDFTNCFPGKRFIYSRDMLLEIGKKSCSRRKPEGLNKAKNYTDKIILDSPLDSIGNLRSSNMIFPKPTTKTQYSSWRQNTFKGGNSMGGFTNNLVMPSGCGSSNITTGMSGQKYINLGHNDITLSHSENGYITIRKRLAAGEEIQETEELVRQIKAILNKIVPQNFDQCLNDLVNLKIGTHEGMNCLVNELFLKAVKEEAYSVTFAKICSYLSQIKADVSENEIVTFRSVLLQKCQTMFTTPLDQQLEQVRQDWLERAAGENAKIKVLMESDVEEQVKKAKDRYYGNIRFIGELYLKNVLITKIICFCIDNLMTKDNDSDALICLCKLLETCGNKLETEPKGKDKLNDSFNKLDQLSSNVDVESRVRYRIKDIIEMRGKNWSLRSVQKEQKIEPKTLEEIKADKQRELLHQQQQQYEFSRSNISNTSANQDMGYNSLNRRLGNSVMATDRRMSVPSMTGSNPRNSPKNSSINLRLLTCSSAANEASLAPMNFEKWNKGSGCKNSVSGNSINRNGNDGSSGSIDQDRSSKWSNKQVPYQQQSQQSRFRNTMPTPVLAQTAEMPLTNYNEFSISKTNRVNTSSSSSPPLNTAATTNINSFPATIAEVDSPLLDSAITTTTTDVFSHSPLISSGATVPVATSSSSQHSPDYSSTTNISNSSSLGSCVAEIITSEMLLKQYFQDHSFCDHSWNSYKDKVDVVYKWLDSSIDSSRLKRNSISSLLIKLLTREILEKDELVQAFSKLMENHEDLQIDVGPNLWQFIADYLVSFIECLSLTTLDFLESVFLSNYLYCADTAIQFYSSVWSLVNNTLTNSNLSTKATTSTTSSITRDIFHCYLNSISSFSKFTSTSNDRFCNILNDIIGKAVLLLLKFESIVKYKKWLQDRLDQACDTECKMFFIASNWTQLLQQLKCDNDENLHMVVNYATELMLHTFHNEHFIALRILIQNGSISDQDLILLMWKLYQNKICDLKALSTWWSCESQTLLNSSITSSSLTNTVDNENSNNNNKTIHDIQSIISAFIQQHSVLLTSSPSSASTTLCFDEFVDMLSTTKISSINSKNNNNNHEPTITNDTLEPNNCSYPPITTTMSLSSSSSSSTSCISFNSSSINTNSNTTIVTATTNINISDDVIINSSADVSISSDKCINELSLN